VARADKRVEQSNCVIHRFCVCTVYHITLDNYLNKKKKRESEPEGSLNIQLSIMKTGHTRYTNR